MRIIRQFFLCVLTVSPIAMSAPPDNGNPLNLKIGAWGTATDADGDCTIKEDGGKLFITVPGTLHNLNPSISSNAPRVLQDVEGDFTVTVKVTGDFLPGDKKTKPSGYPFVGAGLLLWQDDKNCVRLERNNWRIAENTYAHYTPLLEYYKDGAEQPTNLPGTTSEFFKGQSTYFGFERKGDKLAAFYSHDGKEWFKAKEITVDLHSKLKVGVAAVNSSDKPFAVEFEEFKVSAAASGAGPNVFANAKGPATKAPAAKGPETRAVEIRAGQVAGVLPRDPKADVRLIDLTHYYTLGLNEDATGVYGYTLGMLPTGIQTLGGVQYDLRGIVQVSSEQFVASHKGYPESVKGIKVGVKSAKLTFLHASRWTENEGTKIGSYVVHYANGETRDVPILFGVNLRDWTPNHDPGGGAATPTVAWRGKDAAGLERVLFQLTWTNPLPDVQITAIDVVSAMSNAAPFLVAVTGE